MGAFDIIVRESKLPAKGKIQEIYLAQTQQMRLIAEAAQEAMDEVSNVHGYATFKTVSTLAAMEVLRKAALEGQAPETVPDGDFREEYKTLMKEITKIAGDQITEQLRRR
jgi:hypothetical protein